jgi:uncharacterized small protein (TIGR04563 family)
MQNAKSNDVEQALHWPAPMLAHIEREALRLGRTSGWCVEKAWSLARAELSTVGPSGKHTQAEEIFTARYGSGGGSKQKGVVTLSEGVREALKLESARLDRSMSWVAQRSWCIAADAIAAMPKGKRAKPSAG